MKRLLIALLLAVTLCLAMAVPVMADKAMVVPPTPVGDVLAHPIMVNVPPQAIDNSPAIQ